MTYLRVSNLDRLTSEEDLFQLFEEFGEVLDVTLNEYPDKGKDTFSAWVEMEFESEAEEARKELSGERIDGNFIKVQITEPSLSSDSEDDDLEDDEIDANDDVAGEERITRKRPGVAKDDRGGKPKKPTRR